MGLISAGLCDIGRKRKSNQDSIYINAEKHIFVIADGMGGHNGGDIASAMAVKLIPDYVLDHYNDEDPKELQKRAIQFANRLIKNKGEENPELSGMGTTVTSLIFRGSQLLVGNVGDSRCYLINRKNLYQLTKDHSLVQEKLNLGFYDRDQAAQDPHKNVLVRTVGFEEQLEVDVFNYKVHRNDIFLSCSDGLHGKISDRDIHFIIDHFIPEPAKATQDDIQRCCRFLIDQANTMGGNDNISVILIVAQ